MERPIPRDTRNAVTNIRNANPSLVWDKLLEPGGPGADEYKVVVPELELPGVRVNEVQAVGKRRRAYLDKASARGLHVASFDATVESRLAVGFGAEHITETNIRLERLRGFPIIPGSACKGLARAAAIIQVAQALDLAAAPPSDWQPHSPNTPLPETPLRLLSELLEMPVPDAADQHANDAMTAVLRRLQRSAPTAPASPQAWLQRRDVAQIRAVFGGRDGRGQVVFLDAVPRYASRLHLDIVTPHFGAYYGDKNAGTPPSDTGSPKPTRFLVVPGGVQFAFALTSRSSECLNDASRWLRRALVELGAGAKTAAGYGFFRVSESIT